MSSQACLDNISKESHDLGYCQNDTSDSLICNSYLEGFKIDFAYLESTGVCNSYLEGFKINFAYLESTRVGL